MRRFWHVKLVMAKLLNECLPTTMLLINSAAAKIVTDEYGMKKVVVDKQVKEDIQQNLMLQIFLNYNHSAGPPGDQQK